MDVCCLNRPFDDQKQERIHLEAEAVLLILNECRSGNWKLINSNALDAEIGQTPSLAKIRQVRNLLSVARIKVQTSEELEQRVFQLTQLGFGAYDAAHTASAERGRSDVFLTTDDRLLRRANKQTDILRLKVSNPVQWLAQVIQAEESNDDDTE
jgi:predicted nucleic acid-binding protein